MKRSSSESAVLITIPLSHYCEKARWGLDRVGLPYVEQAHAPLLHRLATMREGGGTVPLLVHAGQTIRDSKSILAYGNEIRGGNLLYPPEPDLRREVAVLEERFDKELGPHTRRWAYSHLLPHPHLIRAIWSKNAPPVETRLLLLIAPLVRRLVRSTYKITPESAARSLERIRSIFALVDGRLSEGRNFLAGDRFTAADLTFASLAAPVLFPLECRAVLPALDAVPDAMRAEIAGFRDTRAGQFALRMYAQERGS